MVNHLEEVIRKLDNFVVWLRNEYNPDDSNPDIPDDAVIHFREIPRASYAAIKYRLQRGPIPRKLRKNGPASVVALLEGIQEGEIKLATTVRKVRQGILPHRDILEVWLTPFPDEAYQYFKRRGYI